MQKSILIVDDEIALAKALQLKFNHLGHTTAIAANGAEALEKIEAQHFDLILLDLLMPVMDGWEVLAKVQGKGLAIIITSNLGQPEDVVKAKSLGALDFLIKSENSLAEISTKIAQYLQ